MPMSRDFEQRLLPRLPAIIDHFRTPFHIYDESGIVQHGQMLKHVFQGPHIRGFKEFFAVKALPNFEILKIMHRLGFGFDCSSIPELMMAREIGARPDDVMFTSNNTGDEEFSEALQEYGCILNLDDISLIDRACHFRNTKGFICLRYNPGERRTGNAIIGNPVDAKYGVRHDQIVGAYIRAKKLLNPTFFGLHTMICSNELNYQYMVETIKMLLEIVNEVSGIGIWIDFINIGGGMGIPYKPEQQAFDFVALAREADSLLEDFEDSNGDFPSPRLFMESGRAMTGPHGVLVTKVINRMSKYREYVGVNACMSSLMRPAMYDAYHHITVYDRDGHPKTDSKVIVNVVGSLCENNDQFAKRRELPEVSRGDILIIHDTGAHGHAMGFQYNGRLRPKELLLHKDGSVELIRRAETPEDYFRTMVDFKPDVLSAS